MVTLVLKKIDGRLAFIPPEGQDERTALKLLFNLCERRHNGFVSLTFAAPYKKRTTGRNSQNNCIHGYAQIIADYTGETVDRIKDFCKKRAFRRGYPAKVDGDGDIIYSPLDGEPVPESTANVNTVQAGYVIEELQALAAELCLVLPAADNED